MNLHEDFGDEPSIEERMPFGISPEEMREGMIEAFMGVCEFCGVSAPRDEFIETGMYEYRTMDLDPDTLACAECLEEHRLTFIPDDPSLFDCYTPVEVY